MEKAYQLKFQPERGAGLSVNFCGYSQTGPLHSFGPAVKPHYLIHYVMNGHGTFTTHGKKYPLEAGYGFLIYPDEVAFYQADEQDPWAYLWVGFDGENAGDYLAKMGLSGVNPIFKCEDSGRLYQCVLDMMEHNTYSTPDELRRNGQLGIFLSIIAEESTPVASTNEEDRANQYVQKALEFVQSNYCNPIKVTDVANYVCINRSYLYTLFKQATGMSPQKFLSVFRLSKASELLQLTDLTVESIALSCGYSDPLVFTKAFHQMRGMSPSAYRKDFLNGEGRKDEAQLRELEAFIAKIQELKQ